MPRQGHNTPFPLERSPPGSFKRLLDGALFSECLSAPRAVGRPRPPLDWDLASEQPTPGRQCAARRAHGAAVGWWGAASSCSLARLGARRPAHIPYQQSVAKECLWKGSAPPNGSRLSCGRPVRRRKRSGRTSVPARAQHSVSFKTIAARQLQALVRQPLGSKPQRLKIAPIVA